MRKSRRQIANRIIEVLGASVIALNLVVYFAVYRPLGDKLVGQTHRQSELRQSIRNEQVRVDVLKRYQADMPLAGKELEEFMNTRTPSRREAFSTASHLIHKVADASGVQLANLGFQQEKERRDPLERLVVEITAEGSYPSLMKFSHALETASDFIVVHDFALAPGTDNAAVALRLGADLYLTP